MNSMRFPALAGATPAATIVSPSRVNRPSGSVADASPLIVSPAAIAVRPTAVDAAYYRAHRIVQLPAITMQPEAADRRSFLAGLALQESLACRC